MPINFCIFFSQVVVQDRKGELQGFPTTYNLPLSCFDLCVTVEGEETAANIDLIGHNMFGFWNS